MIRWALRRAIDKVERNLNTDASYVWDMIDRVRVPCGSFSAPPPSESSGVTSPSRHGLPPG
jgi:hypothetical protein